MNTDIPRHGHLLATAFGEPVTAPVFYRMTPVGSDRTTLIDSGCAQTLLESARDCGVQVAGDLELGFAVRTGSTLRHGYTVVPGQSTRCAEVGLISATIELYWPPADGHRLVRRWFVLFPSWQDAELTACCLWSRASTGRDALGRGADRAMLIDVRGMATEITEMRDTCAHFGSNYIKRFTACQRDAFEPYPPTEPLPNPGPPPCPSMPSLSGRTP